MSEAAKNTLSLWGTLALIVGVLYVSYAQLNADDESRELERARYITKVRAVNQANYSHPAYKIYPKAPHLLKYKKRKPMHKWLLDEEE
jgi:hypothetical protein